MTKIFDGQAKAERAGDIGEGILEARSIRLTSITANIEGISDAYFKRIQ